MVSTAELLRQRNRKTIWLREEVDAKGEAQAVPAVEGEGLPFVIVRVRASQIGDQAMLALLGEDEFVKYANWYAKQGADALAAIKTETAKSGDASPFDDSMPASEDFTAHNLALNKVMHRAVLREGMLEPSYAEMDGALGLYEQPLLEAIRTFGREVVGGSSDSLSGRSVPP